MLRSHVVVDTPADDAVKCPPTWKPGIVTTVIVLLNVAAYVVGPRLVADFDSRFWLESEAMLQGEYYRLITSVFLHGGWFHLVTNMVVLMVVGLVVERAIGPWRYLIIYILTSVCGGSLFFYGLSPTSSAHASGASGGIFGLACPLLFLVKDQSERMRVVPLYFGYVFAVLANGSGGLAHRAHLGGFAAGAILTAIVRCSARVSPVVRRRIEVGTLIFGMVAMVGATVMRTSLIKTERREEYERDTERFCPPNYRELEVPTQVEYCENR